MEKVNDNPSLEQLLMQEMSRRNMDQVVMLVRQNRVIFDELFGIFLKHEEPVSRRAAWVIDLASEEEPDLLADYLESLVYNLPRCRHDGMKRHSLRMLARSPLPSEDTLGRLISVCFDWLLAAGTPVAVKVHSIDILYRAAMTEPELQRELADVISWRMEEESAGFRNKAAKTLKKLHTP